MLVVPHAIMRQWQSYLKHVTPWHRWSVFKRRTATRDGTQVSDVRSGVDVLLVQSNFYNDACASPTCASSGWWDEADTAPVASSAGVRASFYWLVTSSFPNLFCPRGVRCRRVRTQGFIRYVIDEMRLVRHWRAYVVRSPDWLVRRSFTLDEPEEVMHVCRRRWRRLAREAQMRDSVLSALDAGDPDSALASLGFGDPLTGRVRVQAMLVEAFAAVLQRQVRDNDLEVACPEPRAARGLTAGEQAQLESAPRWGVAAVRLGACWRVCGGREDGCLICHCEPDESRFVTRCCRKQMCSACALSFMQYRRTAHPPCPNCRAPARSVGGDGGPGGGPDRPGTGGGGADAGQAGADGEAAARRGAVPGVQLV